MKKVIEKFKKNKMTIYIFAIIILISFVFSKILTTEISKSTQQVFFSTQTQVISGLYGLSITAFVFFSGNFSGNSDYDDETLKILLNKRKNQLVQTTTFVVTVIFFSIFSIFSSELYSIFPSELLRIVLSMIIHTLKISSICFFGIALGSIIKLSFILVNPQEVAKKIVSEELDILINNEGTKSEISQNYLSKGELKSKFLEEYVKFDKLLTRELKEYYPEFFSERQKKGWFSITGKAKCLIENGYKQLKEDSLSEINDIRKFRNGIVHDSNNNVSEDVFRKMIRKLDELNMAVNYTSVLDDEVGYRDVLQKY